MFDVQQQIYSQKYMNHFVNIGFLIIKDADGMYQQNLEAKKLCENYLANDELDFK